MALIEHLYPLFAALSIPVKLQCFGLVCALCMSYMHIFMTLMVRVSQAHGKIWMDAPFRKRSTPAWFFTRFLSLWWFLCHHLLYLLLNPLIQLGIDGGGLHVWRFDKIIWNLWCSLCYISQLSHKRTLRCVSWQGIHCHAWGHFVSRCFGQFNLEANLLPLLFIHTVSTITNGVA